MKEMIPEIDYNQIPYDKNSSYLYIFCIDTNEQKRGLVTITNAYAEKFSNENIKFTILQEKTIMFGLLSLKLTMIINDVSYNIATFLSTEGEHCITYNTYDDNLKYGTIDTTLHYLIILYLPLKKGSNSNSNSNSSNNNILYTLIRVLTYLSHYIEKNNINCFGKIWTPLQKFKVRGELMKKLNNLTKK
jgi:hypothetical protein